MFRSRHYDSFVSKLESFSPISKAVDGGQTGAWLFHRAQNGEILMTFGAYIHGSYSDIHTHMGFA